MNVPDADRFERIIAAIDAANAQDPSSVLIDGNSRPGEVVYSERMTRALAALQPEASEPLQVAVRAQHIQRWTVPRATYPMDRTGYLRWRTDLKRKHAELTAHLMTSVGYPAEVIARTGTLIRKERLKQDAESQTLEDVACLVFLEHYIDDFAAKHDDDKLVSILRKTWAKMSVEGRAAALRLKLSPRVLDLVGRALNNDEAT